MVDCDKIRHIAVVTNLLGIWPFLTFALLTRGTFVGIFSCGMILFLFLLDIFLSLKFFYLKNDKITGENI